jgi:hypothetical protein
MMEEENFFMASWNKQLKAANIHEGPWARMESSTHFITMADMTAIGTINRHMGIV